MKSFRTILTLLINNKRIATLLCLLFGTILLIDYSSSAQSNESEKLLTELTHVTQDSLEISELNQLSYRLIEDEPEKSLIYARSALVRARKMDDQEQEARAMFNIGLILFETPKVDS